jgi:hypothetical protein
VEFFSRTGETPLSGDGFEYPQLAQRRVDASLSLEWGVHRILSMVFIKITHFTNSTRETIFSSSGDVCSRRRCPIDVAFLPGKRDFRRPLVAFFLCPSPVHPLGVRIDRARHRVALADT